ncbi:MAG TPA: SIR2 family protein [Fervidobacterium sp.]|jgi:hypothetical protein|nr:SIR2 family protein [Fervidobacterium sp.]
MFCSKQHKNTYIVGSGFTKSIFPNAPLNNDLMELLANKPDSVSPVLMKRYKTTDIEVALTKLHLDLISSCCDEKKRLQHEIKTELGDHFRSYKATPETIEQLPWLCEFMRSTINDGDVIVSLNYDCVFEGALDCVGRWSPNGGYGFFKNPLIDNHKFKKSAVTVLKIHGSTSFKIAPIAPYVDNPSFKAVSFVFNADYFPCSADVHFNYGMGMGETYLIEPSYVKLPTVEIAYLMIDALKAVSESKNLIILGCSLRNEDSFLTLLITQFLRHPKWQSRKIVILDKNAEEISLKIKRYWTVDVDKCIIPIVGCIQDSINELPKIIKT